MGTQVLHQNLSDIDQSHRIRVRCEIEKFCEAVELLPPKKRIIFRLFFRDGESMASIARACNVCEGTISRQLRKIAKEVEKTVYG